MKPTLFFCEWDCPDSGEIHTIESLVHDYYETGVFGKTSEPWQCYAVAQTQPVLGVDDDDMIFGSWGSNSSLLGAMHSLMNVSPSEADRRFYFVCENMTIMIAAPDHLADKTNTRRDLGKSKN